jgi:hypothetical protein
VLLAQLIICLTIHTLIFLHILILIICFLNSFMPNIDERQSIKNLLKSHIFDKERNIQLWHFLIHLLN